MSCALQVFDKMPERAIFSKSPNNDPDCNCRSDSCEIKSAFKVCATTMKKNKQRANHILQDSQTSFPDIDGIPPVTWQGRLTCFLITGDGSVASSKMASPKKSKKEIMSETFTSHLNSPTP
ncbi:hypothetical protein L1887_19601 [Cichorium endivia]|nr:hypothetical protein L1887_19601 [Cichorium endivia]